MDSAKDAVGMKLIIEEIPEHPLMSESNPTVAGSASNPWGLLPLLSLTSAVGVMLLALAAEAGRLSSHWADLLFWLGLLVLFLPIAIRIISEKPTRQERITLLAILGSALYLLRDLEQPLAFSFNDEFFHWRGALDIVSSGHLFVPSPILTIGPFYPGLEIVTTALSGLTGLSIFASGMILLGVAGLVLVLSLYLFYEYLSGSAQVAAIATLLNIAAPAFFGDTQFVYEALGIPLMAFVLFAVVRRSYAPAGHRKGLTLAVWLGIAAVVVTHHVTSFVLTAFLLLWTVTFLLPRLVPSFRRKHGWGGQASPRGAALLALLLSGAWLVYTGAQALGYLYPSLRATVIQVVLILKSENTTRQLFHTTSGFVEPFWERMTALAAAGLIALGLPFGLYQIWRHFRANAAAVALAIGALLYPASLAVRLTPNGETIGGRAQPYLFIMLAFVLALAISRLWLSRWTNWKYRVPLIGAIAIIFIGGWVTGTAPLWDRLPGPFLASSDQRSIQPESVTAAQWASSYLGSGQRMIADQYNVQLMATEGNEWIVTSANSNVVVESIFTSPHFDLDVQTALRQGKIQYIVIDRRLIGSEEVGVEQTIDAGMLAKFDGVQYASRVFDSGNIVIYDVTAISTGAATPVQAPTPTCTPGSLTAASGSYPSVAKLYTGTLYDIPTGLKTNLSLSGVQQKHGDVCGYFGGMPTNSSFTAIPANGIFTGAITPNKQFQFRVLNNKAKLVYNFEGTLFTDGSIAGTYCGQKVAATTCSDYGLWSVSPASAG